jgi:hypothetical protein
MMEQRRKPVREAHVSRVMEGSSHRNTLLIRLLEVEIFIDKDEIEDTLCDFYQLTSEDRAYDQILCRREAISFDKDLWVLVFTNILPGRNYSLYHLLEEGVRVPVFVDVPLGALKRHGSETPAPRDRTAEEPPPLPEPEVRSGIDVVMNTEVNHTVDGAEYRPDPHLEMLA